MDEVAKLVGRGPMPETGQAAMVRPASLTERLKAQREVMAAELKRLDDAIEALEAHPEVASTLDSISKIVGRF